jgi:hypothetical protein
VFLRNPRNRTTGDDVTPVIGFVFNGQSIGKLALMKESFLTEMYGPAIEHNFISLWMNRNDRAGKNR